MGLGSVFKPLAQVGGAALGGSLGGWGGALAGLGAASSFFGNKKPTGGDAAMEYLQRVPEYGERAYRPYITEGQKLDPRLSGEYERMQQDPGAIIDALMERYQPSKFYQLKRDQMLGAARNTAAAGGYAGTSSDQQKQMELVDALASSDMQQWLNNVLGQRMAGLAGQQGISDRGYDASSRLADYLGGAQGQMGGAAYGRATDRYNRSAGFNSGLMNLGVNVLGSKYGLDNLPKGGFF